MAFPVSLVFFRFFFSFSSGYANLFKSLRPPQKRFFDNSFKRWCSYWSFNFFPGWFVKPYNRLRPRNQNSEIKLQCVISLRCSFSSRILTSFPFFFFSFKFFSTRNRCSWGRKMNKQRGKKKTKKKKNVARDAQNSIFQTSPLDWEKKTKKVKQRSCRAAQRK